MKFFVRLSLLVLLLLCVVLLWGLSLIRLPPTSLFTHHRPFESSLGHGEQVLKKEWMWPNSNVPVGPSATSKQIFLQPQRAFNRTLKNGILAHRIASHRPNMVEYRPSLSQELPTTKNGLWGKVDSDRQHEWELQSVDARKGRSVQSFAVEATRSSNKENYQDSTNLSEHPDMEVRGKWQQEVISDFCYRHGLDNLTGTLPDEPIRSDFLRRVIFDEHHKALFCFLPKVGCTNMRISLLVSSARVSPAVLKLRHKKDFVEKKLERALKKASLLSTLLTNETRQWMISQFQKYTIIRHPLERLASAYRDKMSGPLFRVIEPFNYFQHLKHSILEEYEPYLYHRWQEEKLANMSLSFTVFITWLTEHNSSEINEHFMMQVANCQPCLMHYHFYGNFKTFVNDSLQILSKFTDDLSPFSYKGYYAQELETRQLLPTYYSQLTPNLRENLRLHMQLELDFYHSLYPSEKQLTEDLIGS